MALNRFLPAAAFLTAVVIVPAWSLGSEEKIQAGLDLEKQGKTEQARALFQELANAPVQGPWVAEALLGLARIGFQAQEPPASGPFGVRPEILAESRKNLETLLTRFPEAPAAAEGAWRLALLALHPETPSVPAEEIRRWVKTMEERFPASPFLPRARALLGWVELQEGRLEPARGLAALSLADDPRGSSASLAWTVLALAGIREGKNEEGLVGLGLAQRTAERGSSLENFALDLATLIDRWNQAALPDAHPYSSELLVGPEIEGRPADMSVGPDGAVALVFTREGLVLSLRHASAVEDRVFLPGVQAVAFDRWGRLWTATPAAVSCGTFTLPLPGESEILALAPSGPRSAWVVEGRKKRVWHLGARTIEALLPPKTDPTKVVAADDGGAWVLDERTPALLRLTAEGTVSFNLALEGVSEKPIDLERDLLGHLYLLDGKLPGVLVFDDTGHLIVRWPFPVVEKKPGVGRPMLLGVERAGGLVIHDAKQGRVLWVR